MKKNWLYILYILLLLGNILPSKGHTCITDKDFVLVIDAGHGGHDPGAIGRISKEKNINLNVALKLGKLVEENCPDVKVIYTRQRDVFIPLDRRAQIANDAKADLFISIHTNSLAQNRTVKGASTWTLGLAKSQANLEVAQRENAVILYEDDYKTRYAGFNPNSAESYIIFEFMQDKYMEQSVHLASLVQKQFRHTCKRHDRGVHQAGFLVLKASAMPSILIELGFISTPEEERYLNSQDGINTLALGIYQAFCTYKQEQKARRGDANSGNRSSFSPQKAPNAIPASAQPKEEGKKTVNGRPVFKIQICTSAELLKSNDYRLKGLKGVEHYQEGGLYKYTYGASEDYNAIVRLRRDVIGKFKDAFIIAFRNGQKTDVNQAIRDFKKNNSSN